MSSKTDEEVALRVQKGDTDSFGLLIERYEVKLLRYAKRFIFDREDGRDLIQNVFLKAYVNIKSFDVGRKFSSWIYRIAHNEFVNEIKRRSKFQFFSFESDIIFPHLVSNDEVDTEFERKELKERLDNYLDKLDVKYREPLILFYSEDLSYKEISEILEIPISTVGVRVQRGRALLRRMIK